MSKDKATLPSKLEDKLAQTTITARISRVIFRSEDFAILLIQPSTASLVQQAQTIKGNIRSTDLERFLSTNAQVTFKGKIESHTKYGEQLKFETYNEFSAATLGKEASPAILAAFIASNLSGFGKVYSTQLITNCGGAESFVHMIETAPEDLSSFHNKLTIQQAFQLAEAWSRDKAKMRVLSFFAEHSITGVFPHRFFDLYGDTAINVVTNNPYVLITEVEGIGFKRADEIALKLGTQRDSPQRLQAGILYALEQQCVNAGNVYLTEKELVLTAKKAVEMASIYIEDQLEKMIEAGDERIVIDGGELGLGREVGGGGYDGNDGVRGKGGVRGEERIYLKNFYEEEIMVADRVKEMLR